VGFNNGIEQFLKRDSDGISNLPAKQRPARYIEQAERAHSDLAFAGGKRRAYNVAFHGYPRSVDKDSDSSLRRQIFIAIP